MHAVDVVDRRAEEDQRADRPAVAADHGAGAGGDEPCRNLAAASGGAVVVGRCSFHVLRDVPGAVRVFLHADPEFRCQRVRELYGVEDEAVALRMIADSDRERRRFVERVAAYGAGGIHPSPASDGRGRPGLIRRLRRPAANEGGKRSARSSGFRGKCIQRPRNRIRPWRGRSSKSSPRIVRISFNTSGSHAGCKPSRHLRAREQMIQKVVVRN